MSRNLSHMKYEIIIFSMCDTSRDSWTEDFNESHEMKRRPQKYNTSYRNEWREEEFYNRVNEIVPYLFDQISERSNWTIVSHAFEIRESLSTIKSDIPAPHVLYYFLRREWGLDRDGKFSAKPALYDRLNREFNAPFRRILTHIIDVFDRFMNSDDSYSVCYYWTFSSKRKQSWQCNTVNHFIFVAEY